LDDVYGSLFFGLSRDSGSGAANFGSEELLGEGGLDQALGVVVGVLLLVSVGSPPKAAQTEVHDFVIEVESFSDVHSNILSLVDLFNGCCHSILARSNQAASSGNK
jgi:hypothetical protein